jgi:hypothetical protein|tara:strand:+ start:471 stop:704 length:234 start_codon:yes stop_codon:yes gene_type:complete
MVRMNRVPLHGQIMPDASTLSTATGQLGPICAITGKAMTFAEAMVLDDKFVCWEAYVEATGADSATDDKYVSDLNLE